MKRFERRYYSGMGAAFHDLKSFLDKRKEAKELGGIEEISPAFRERLMLAVTEVNQCRYCSFAHSRMALKEGIDQKELSALLNGVFLESPEEELPAILYAQHWAETQGETDSETKQKIINKYGDKKFLAIELSLLMIQMGNLWGNTLDFILFRLSFGRMGLTHEEGES